MGPAGGRRRGPCGGRESGEGVSKESRAPRREGVRRPEARRDAGGGGWALPSRGCHGTELRSLPRPAARSVGACGVAWAGGWNAGEGRPVRSRQPPLFAASSDRRLTCGLEAVVLGKRGVQFSLSIKKAKRPLKSFAAPRRHRIFFKFGLNKGSASDPRA